MTNAVRRRAIYTSKSSEEGLEQDYNSLHAQREACEAFIRSQTGEGWRAVKAAYDDGGFSGYRVRPKSRRSQLHIEDSVAERMDSNQRYRLIAESKRLTESP